MWRYSIFSDVLTSTFYKVVLAEYNTIQMCHLIQRVRQITHWPDHFFVDVFEAIWVKSRSLHTFKCPQHFLLFYVCLLLLLLLIYCVFYDFLLFYHMITYNFYVKHLVFLQHVDERCCIKWSIGCSVSRLFGTLVGRLTDWLIIWLKTATTCFNALTLEMCLNNTYSWIYRNSWTLNAVNAN